MFTFSLTTCILAIIWVTSFLLIVASLNAGRNTSRPTLIVATTLSAIFRLIPEDTLLDLARSFHRNVFVAFPTTVISTAIGIFLAYLYIFNYASANEPEDPPPNLKRPGETD